MSSIYPMMPAEQLIARLQQDVVSADIGGFRRGVEAGVRYVASYGRLATMFPDIADSLVAEVLGALCPEPATQTHKIGQNVIVSAAESLPFDAEQV